MSRQWGLPPPPTEESGFPPGAALFAIAFGVLVAAVFIGLLAVVLRVM